MGSRTDGSSTPPPANPASVVWVDHGDEVLVHLDSIATKILKTNLLVSVDLETDQTGRSPLVVVLAMAGAATDPAGLIATTDEYPRGNGALASRWGRLLQNAIWACVVAIAQDHASQTAAAPHSIVLTPGALQFVAAPPLRIDASLLPKLI